MVGAVRIAGNAAVALDQVGQRLESPIGGLDIAELIDAGDLFFTGVLVDAIEIQIGGISRKGCHEAKGRWRHQQLLEEFHGD